MSYKVSVSETDIFPVTTNVFACSYDPSQHMNFNFFLKDQFWSYEHAKTFAVIGNMSVSLTETL